MHEARYHHPETLVSGDWLERRLTDPALRIFDCTTYLHYEENTGRPYRVVSGRSDYEAAHIPGSGFLDLQQAFSVADSPYRFTLPSPVATAEAFARHGVGDGHRIILYSRGNMQWATRFWWMLRWLGFDAAAILDGGYDKWRADGRPVSSEPCRYPAAKLSIHLRPALFVGKDAVLAAIGNPGICTINALAPDLHAGENPRYGRAGRIPGSKNVPARSLVNPETMELLPAEDAAKAFVAVGANAGRRTIVYCGGGIAATMDAYVLTQLGHTDVAVYDNSMSEWAADATLPVEKD